MVSVNPRSAHELFREEPRMAGSPEMRIGEANIGRWGCKSIHHIAAKTLGHAHIPHLFGDTLREDLDPLFDFFLLDDQGWRQFQGLAHQLDD